MAAAITIQGTAIMERIFPEQKATIMVVPTICSFLATFPVTVITMAAPEAAGQMLLNPM
ncbi:hypothetical protein [Candidatus Methylobacter oryzae]|uniref:hypothetical protein n=1 Tax=Candidatus Methylobacter oryzae TaxID=2497749 RepID=UPI001386ED62